MPKKSVSVTYKAPPGDSKVVEAFGHTFYDGKAETVTVDEDVLEKLQGNKHFKCGEPKDAPDEKPDPAKEKAAEAAALAEENAKREAQGQPPIETDDKHKHDKPEAEEGKKPFPPGGSPGEHGQGKKA
jgi:hypothetical protein